MEVLIILIVVVSIISSLANNKKQADAKRAAQASQTARVRAAENMRERVQNNTAQARPAQSTMKPTVQATRVAPRVSTPQYSGSMSYNSTEGVGGVQGTSYGSTEGTSYGSSEGMYGTQGRAELNESYNKPRHIVTPSTVSGHVHTESSITGVTDCAPDASPLEFEHEDAYSGEIKTGEGLKLNISKNAVLQGIVFSEVIGRPRALKKYSRA